MAFHHSPRIVQDGLKFLMDIPNSKSWPGSGTTITDMIESKTGALSNAVVVDGIQGHISFDGSGDYLTLSETISLGGTYTWECFFKHDTVSNGGYGYFNQVEVANQGGFAISEGGTGHGGVAGGMYYYGGANANAISTIALDIDRWYHVCFVCTTSTKEVKTYINGALDSTNTVTDTLRDGFVKIGWNGGAWYITGDIAHYAMYTKKLSDAEVLQNYNALKGRFE